VLFRSFLDGIAARFPEDGSEKKAMRWLGYAQGVAHALGYYSLDEIKAHSRDRVITPPTGLNATLLEHDAVIAERDELKRRIETMPPWPDDGHALDDAQMRALMLRWSTGPELYQADADALIATVRSLQGQIMNVRHLAETERDAIRERAVVAEQEAERLRREVEALRSEVDDRMAELEQTKPWGGNDDPDHVVHAELCQVRDRIDTLLASNSDGGKS